MVDKLLYADDLAENAKSEETMQGAVDRMSKACDNFQLTISTKKTEIVHQSAPKKPYSEPTITVNGQKLQVVDKSNRKAMNRYVCNQKANPLLKTKMGNK